MGKKKPEVMAKQKEQFVEGRPAKGYATKVAEEIFDLLVPFAGYGFNKSHAAAYALIAYQTAYLKANYPAEFMAAQPDQRDDSTDKLAEYIDEARGMGIQVLPPDVNLSEGEFAVSKAGSSTACWASRTSAPRPWRRSWPRGEGGRLHGLLDFLDRVDLRAVNRKVVETLVRCGAFDRLDETAPPCTTTWSGC